MNKYEKQIKELELRIESYEKHFMEYKDFTQECARILFAPRVEFNLILDRLKLNIAMNSLYKKQLDIIKEVCK